MHKNSFKKVWGVPIILACITIVGLVLAIEGSQTMRIFAWVLLSIPTYLTIKYGNIGFRHKTKK